MRLLCQDLPDKTSATILTAVWQLKLPGIFSLCSHMLNIPPQLITLRSGGALRGGCFPTLNLCSGGWWLQDSREMLRQKGVR